MANLFCPTTKINKAKKLEELINDIHDDFVKNPNEYVNNPNNTRWIIKVKQAALDEQLTQSYLTKRTRNLLTNIIEGQAEQWY